MDAEVKAEEKNPIGLGWVEIEAGRRSWTFRVDEKTYYDIPEYDVLRGGQDKIVPVYKGRGKKEPAFIRFGGARYEKEWADLLDKAIDAYDPVAGEARRRAFIIRLEEFRAEKAAKAAALQSKLEQAGGLV